MSGKRTLRTGFAVMMLLCAVAGCTAGKKPASKVGAARPAVFVTGSVALPSMPGGVAVDPESHKIYVATPDDNAIRIIDPATKAVVGTISSGTHPILLRIDPQHRRLYSVNSAETNGDGGSIELIDLNTDQITATVPVGDLPMLAVDTESNVAYSISKKDFGLSVIDPERATVTATAEIPHEDTSSLSAMTVDPSAHTLYVTDTIAHTVMSVDPQTGATTPIAEVGDQPADVTVDPATHLLYTADFGMGQGAISVIDPGAHQKVGNIVVGYSPSSVVIDSATHFGYAINADGTMSAVDLTSRTLAGTVHAGKALAAAAVDPATHSVYVADVADKTVLVVDQTGH